VAALRAWALLPGWLPMAKSEHAATGDQVRRMRHRRSLS